MMSSRMISGRCRARLFERLDAIRGGDHLIAVGFKPQRDDFEIFENVVDGKNARAITQSDGLSDSCICGGVMVEIRGFWRAAHAG